MSARFHVQWLRLAVLSATVATSAVVVLASSGSRAGTSLALLEPVAATVSMRHAETAFVEVAASVVLQPGDSVRTDLSGRALVTYSDGTSLVVEPGSELTIEDIQSGGDAFVLITQNAGRVWYALSRTLSPNARYEVRSGALAAVVRAGSTVEVAVAADGTTSVTATQGSAETSSGGSTVTVTQGTTTTAASGQTPAPLVATSVTAPQTSTSSQTSATPAPTSAPTQAPVAVMPLPSVPSLTAGTPQPTSGTKASTSSTGTSQATPAPTPWSPPTLTVPAIPGGGAANGTPSKSPPKSPKPRPVLQPGHADDQRSGQYGRRD